MTMAHDASPEHLLDVFRTAALSVTKLYKSSITAQKKARAEGYQECLDDLLHFLDQENLGLNDGEGWKIRAWANERLDNRDVSPPLEVTESDDDSEKQDAASSPEMHHSPSTASLPLVSEPQGQQQITHMPTITQGPQPEPSRAPGEEDIVVDEPQPEPPVFPTRDTFDFISSHPYPQDAQNSINLAGLQLSDSNRPHERPKTRRGAGRPTRSVRGSNHGPAQHGPRSGSKRHLDFNDFFDGINVKEMGPPQKRRHM